MIGGVNGLVGWSVAVCQVSGCWTGLSGSYLCSQCGPWCVLAAPSPAPPNNKVGVRPVHWPSLDVGREGGPPDLPPTISISVEQPTAVGW